MTWVRIDETFPEHPKVMAAGDDAAWLFVCALAYCNRHLTDGFVPSATVKRLTNHKRPIVLVCKLVEVGLMDRDDEREGWMVHDFLNYQPSKASVEEDRRKARERMANARGSSPNVRPNKSGTADEVRTTRFPPSPPSPPSSSSSSSNSSNGDTRPEEDEDERVTHAIEIHAAWRSRKADDPNAYAPTVQATDRQTKLPDLTACLQQHPDYTVHQLAANVFGMLETDAYAYDERNHK